MFPSLGSFGRTLSPIILLAALLAGCGGGPQPSGQPAAPAAPAATVRLATVDAVCDLLDRPSGAPAGTVEPGARLTTGARQADAEGVVWIEVGTATGLRGWLPETRLTPAGEEGHIATH